MRYFLDTNTFFFKSNVVKYLNGEIDFKFPKDLLEALNGKQCYIPGMVIAEIEYQLRSASDTLTSNGLLSKSDIKKYNLDHSLIIEKIISDIEKYKYGRTPDVLSSIRKNFMADLNNKIRKISDSKDIIIASEVRALESFLKSGVKIVTDNFKDFRNLNIEWITRIKYIRDVLHTAEKLEFINEENLGTWIMEKVFQDVDDFDIEFSDGFQNYYGYEMRGEFIEIQTDYDSYFFPKEILPDSEYWDRLWELIDLLREDLESVIETNKEERMRKYIP